MRFEHSANTLKPDYFNDRHLETNKFDYGKVTSFWKSTYKVPLVFSFKKIEIFVNQGFIQYKNSVGNFLNY
jgi:hypothetical protein